MILQLMQLLPAPLVQALRARLGQLAFTAGTESAQGMPIQHKQNRQLPRNSPEERELGGLILQALAGSPAFFNAALPRQIVPPIFARYEPGMHYGLHTDNSLMPAPQGRVRSDIAMTIFLSEPVEYEGGELHVNTGGGEWRAKLPAGSAVLYPAHTLHQVLPVTAGTRLVAVTWIESMVADTARREVLWDVYQLGLRLQSGVATDAEQRALTNHYHRLIRMWART
jgi:PKHD-type hydroxylase